MGDTSAPHGGRPSQHPPNAYQDENQSRHESQARQYVGQGVADGTAFYSQYSNLPQQPRIDTSGTHHSISAYGTSAGQGHSGQTFNMASVVGALPDYGATQQLQRHLGTFPMPTGQGQQPQIASSPTYVPGYHFGHYQAGTSNEGSAQASLQSQAHRAGVAQSGFSPHSQQMPQYYYPTSPYSPQGQAQFFPGPAQQFSMYGDRRGSLGPVQSLHPGVNRPLQVIPGYAEVYGSGGQVGIEEASQRSPSGSSSIPRGPPRKPKQSGHALWVGNLPPGTTVTSLKDHFSRDATNSIESLFLISKSNCAFVNYRTEAACTAASQRFHDSRFHGVRLVCRLRRPPAAPSGAPSGPSSMSNTSPEPATSSQNTPESAQPLESPVEEGQKADDAQQGEEHISKEGLKDRYFVVKSLTLQDLELSVRNGVWATQSHNEEALNKAFESAENVYLIFSANKSGEYFGYARMTSPILQDNNVLVSSPSHEEQTFEASDAPRIILTEATEFAPKGRIIDDSARGTIFWEADLSDEEDDKDKDGKVEEATPADEPGQQAWGKPFKIEWLSTSRLPFYRTRGLRNPWNSNREVKIARDGTELEPGVGGRVIQMFHRLGQPAPSATGIGMPSTAGLGFPAQMQPKPY